ncbi:MAG: type II toxin-antitoxin system RelE/ParE family toxin [Pseudomonadales bacterium]
MDEIAGILAGNPESGSLMQGTGGCRKLRYAGVQGKGKSGGSRIIHLYVTSDQEVHLLDIYGKNEKSNMIKAERNELAKLAAVLKGD